MINAVYKLYTALLVHRILITSRIVTASKVVHSLYPLLSSVTLLFSFEKVLLSTLSFFFFSSLFPFLKISTDYHSTSAVWLHFSTALTSTSGYKKDEL